MAFLYFVSGFVGLALLILAAVFAFRRHRLWRDGVRATGHVVGHYESRSRTTFVEIPQDSGHRTFFPVIEFAGPGGNPVRFTASVGVSPRFKLGAAVEVLYLRDRPTEASLGEFSAIWGMPMFAAGFAAFNLVVCILGFWMDDRVRPAFTLPSTSEIELRASDAGNGDSAGQR